MLAHTNRSILLTLWLLLSVASDLSAQNEGTELEQSLTRIKEGMFSFQDVDFAAKSGAADKIIPILKEHFDRSSKWLTKPKSAAALIRLGVRDDVYWEFLAKQASAAVESEVPFPLMFDSQGKVVKEALSPEFLSWAKTHSKAANEAAYAQFYEIPGSVLLLGMTRDARALAIFRKGMSSPNYYVQAFSARGLAKMKDADSISIIIEACEKAPSDVAMLIAQSLLAFNDPRASTAAERFITDTEFLKALRRSMAEKGMDATF